MLFQIYGSGSYWQLLGWVMVFVGLILVNEIARRTKLGGILTLVILPAALTVYFIAIYIGAASGADWALNNPTYIQLVPLCQAVCRNNRLYRIHDAQI